MCFKFLSTFCLPPLSSHHHINRTPLSLDASLPPLSERSSPPIQGSPLPSGKGLPSPSTWSSPPIQGSPLTLSKGLPSSSDRRSFSIKGKQLPSYSGSPLPSDGESTQSSGKGSSSIKGSFFNKGAHLPSDGESSDRGSQLPFGKGTRPQFRQLPYQAYTKGGQHSNFKGSHHSSGKGFSRKSTGRVSYASDEKYNQDPPVPQMHPVPRQSKYFKDEKKSVCPLCGCDSGINDTKFYCITGDGRPCRKCQCTGKCGRPEMPPDQGLKWCWYENNCRNYACLLYHETPDGRSPAKECSTDSPHSPCSNTKCLNTHRTPDYAPVKKSYYEVPICKDCTGCANKECRFRHYFTAEELEEYNAMSL